MPKASVDKGSTNQSFAIFVQDSSSVLGAGLSGLVFNSSGLIAYYFRSNGSSGDTTATAITLASSSLGTYTSGGFKEVDATKMKGVYEVGLPNACFTSGYRSVIVYYSGATNMAPVVLEIELTNTDNQDGVRFGMSALPNASAGAAGGVLTVGNMFIKKNTLLSNFMFRMTDSADHISPKTGLTVTCQRSIDGAAFANCNTATATEVSNGWYKVDLAASDVNGTVIALKFTATGADQLDMAVVTQTD